MIRYIEAKSILSKLKGEDPYFGIAYNMNLYRGCQHGCIYCDTRSECYGVGDISTISVKKNALELLRKELSSKRKSKATIGTGSMNDPYMPLERELQMTRQALQVIASQKFPVHVITKSSLPVRDYDVLQDISKTYAAVSFTITTTNDSLSNRIEPNACSSSERFKAMAFLADKGIYTGVTLMPVLPFINDTKEELEELIRKAKDHGASYILAMFGVTLRKGSRDYFYKALDQNFDGVKNKYQQTFGDSYECFSPHYRVLQTTFMDLAEKLGLETRIRFYTPPIDNQLSLF